LEKHTANFIVAKVILSMHIFKKRALGNVIRIIFVKCSHCPKYAVCQSL